jgi:phosphate transport system protein
MGGTRSQFDRALEAIEAKVIELFAMVAEDLPAATQALLGGGGPAEVLAERERVVDALCREVEVLACRQLLLQAPVACDLRFLLSVLRIAPELERSHDLVMQVASPAGRARAGDLSPHGRGLAERMGASPLACGARPQTPGTPATALPPQPSASVTGRWKTCTPA